MRATLNIPDELIDKVQRLSGEKGPRGTFYSQPVKLK
jgi:hypothetical protein